MSNYYSPSPPPLQHPVPTHPAYIPEPPATPTSPPQGYQRYHPQSEPNNIPDFAAWGLNDATTQFGMHLGQSAVAAGHDYVQKNVRAAELSRPSCSLRCPVRRIHSSQAPLQRL